MAISPEKHWYTRNVYMWLMACMYMFAFASLYTQIPGLYGPNGLTPVHTVIQKTSAKGWFEQFHAFPSLLIFHHELQLLPHQLMELCCVAGVLLSLCITVFQAMRCSLMFFLLWLLYFSVYKVGQVFLWFQWDSLILEAGFLTILVAPFNLVFWRRPPAKCHDGMVLWLVRWLLFRLMFASGVVKLTSLCPTWWGLTALNYHFESQCIPTSLAWYAHQLPEWFLKLSVVGTYFIEIAVPLLFFVPVRSLRIFAFWSQVFFQVCIILTGNYNFFNILTVTLCFSLVDDEFLSWRRACQNQEVMPPWSHRVCNAVFGTLGNSIHRIGRALIFLTVTGYMVALCLYYFDIRLDWGTLSVPSNIVFTTEAFDWGLSVWVPLLALIGAASLLWEIIAAFLGSLRCHGVLWKVWSLLQTTFFSYVVVVMFAISLVSHGVLDRGFYYSIPSEIRRVHDVLDNYAVTNPYGLFRRMTGVSGRPELIIEGSNGLDAEEWKEYEFLYKPGNLYRTLPFVAPHQPRLDWQMWFAALGSYQRNPWLVHLVYRLLIGQKEVLQLLAPPPFEHPPRYIRARLYHYHYTNYDTHRSLFNQTRAWWYREFKNDYLFPLTWDNQGLEDYLNKYNYLSVPQDTYKPTHLSTLLTLVREYADHWSPHSLLWMLFFSAFIPAVIKNFVFSDREVSSQQTSQREDSSKNS